MIDDMGIFRTTIGIASLERPHDVRQLVDVMVDTGSEYNFVPAAILAEIGVVPVRVERFETADGRIIERDAGFAMLYVAGRSTPTIVVFAQDDDLILLGAHGLDGLNLRIDLGRRELVPAGPLPAAGLFAQVISA